MARAVVTLETPAGPVRLTQQGARAFDGLCRTGGDLQLAAAYSGLSTKQVSRIKRMPGVAAAMVQKARQTMVEHSPMAADKVVELMKQDTSLKVSFEAARRVLDVVGVKPPDGPGPQVNIGIGVFPSRHIIDRGAPPEQVKAIKSEWASYGGSGYLIDLREDHEIQAEKVQSGE